MMRVIDLTQGIAGPFATLLLAELGADVIKIEPPGVGDPHRAAAPGSLAGAFDFLNRRKRSVTLDFRNRRGRALLLDLIAGADAVVESFSPGTLARRQLSYQAMRRVNPTVTLASISNFGQDGPRRDWRQTELIAQAMGGIVASTGWENEPPRHLAGELAQHIAGLNAATAVLSALYGLRAGQTPGVHIDLSIQETFAPHWVRHLAEYAYAGSMMRREPRGNGRQGFPHTAMAADGHVYILALYAEWEALAFFLGLSDFLSPEWSDPKARFARWDEIDPAFQRSIASKSKYQWFAEAAARGYTFAPVESPHDVLTGPQTTVRGFMQPAQVDGREVPCPQLPFTGGPPVHRPNRAPALGEHTDAVLSEALGLDEAARGELRAAGVI